MKTIGLFFGSDGGNTEDVSKKLINILGKDNIDLINVAESDQNEISSYDKLIFASSTWGDGDLQSDWDDFSSKLDEVNFENKTVALLGLGDQESYEDTFCNALALLYDKVKDAKVVGQTSTEGYEFADSDSVVDGEFIGLVIDEDNQEELTDERLSNWAKQIKPYFGL